MCFIVGCGRSGTTILGRLAGLHRSVRYLNEPIHYWFAIDPRTDYTAFFGPGGCCWLDASTSSELAARRFARLFGQVQRGRVLVEKLPVNALRMEWIDAICPNARFVNLVRDGRAVVKSIGSIHRSGSYRVAGMEHHLWWGAGWYKWKALAREGYARGFYRDVLTAIGGEGASDPCAMGAYEWLVSIRQVRESARKLGLDSQRLIEVRYERLLRNPEDVIRDLERLLGVPHDERLALAARAQLQPRASEHYNLVLPGPLYEAFVQMQHELGYSICGVRPS